MNTRHTAQRFSLRLGAAGLLVGVVAFGFAKIAGAQGDPGTPMAGFPPFALTFDEQGNSLLNGGPNPLPVTMVSGGGVEFVLPALVIPGDVLVAGALDTAAAGHSDLLTFFNQANRGVLLYESLIDDNDSRLDPADVPTFPVTSNFVVFENGPEGANGFTWTATDPLIGAAANYSGISDGVIPEPSTLVLGALGLMSLAALAFRQLQDGKRQTSG